MSRIYLDNCCLNRPFDDPKQDRIRLEVEAISTIVAKVKRKEVVWVTSAILVAERTACPNDARKSLVAHFFDLPFERVALSWVVVERATKLCKLGLKEYDAFHIAAAERGKCSAFLTTDDRLIARAHKFRRQLKVAVFNPVDWVLENLR